MQGYLHSIFSRSIQEQNFSLMFVSCGPLSQVLYLSCNRFCLALHLIISVRGAHHKQEKTEREGYLMCCWDKIRMFTKYHIFTWRFHTYSVKTKSPSSKSQARGLMTKVDFCCKILQSFYVLPLICTCHFTIRNVKKKKRKERKTTLFKANSAGPKLKSNYKGYS